MSAALGHGRRMFADVHPSLEFDGTPPMPDRILPAPDELHAFVRAHHKGLHRLSVKLMLGRRRYSNVGAIKVGAGFDEVPDAGPDELVEAVMAIACDQLETLDKACKFLVQAHVHKKPTGDAVRKGVHIELGSTRDLGGGYAEEIEDPEKLDAVLLTHIRQCHAEILSQAQVIAEIGRAAIKNAGEVFAAKEDAIQARAEVMQHLAETRIEGQIARNEDKRKGEMMEMLREAIGIAVKQMGDRKKAEKFTVAPAQAAPAQAAPAQAAPAQPANLLTAAMAAPSPAPAPAPTPTKDTTVKTIAQRLKTTLSSLDADQMAQLRKALTKTQWTMLEQAQATTSDADAKPIVQKFAASIERRPATIFKMARVLPADAASTIMDIWRDA